LTAADCPRNSFFTPLENATDFFLYCSLNFLVLGTNTPQNSRQKVAKLVTEGGKTCSIRQQDLRQKAANSLQKFVLSAQKNFPAHQKNCTAHQKNVICTAKNSI